MGWKKWKVTLLWCVCLLEPPLAALPALLRELCGLDGDVVAWKDALAAYPEVGSSEASGPITLETTSRGVFSRPAALVKK